MGDEAPSSGPLACPKVVAVVCSGLETCRISVLEYTDINEQVENL